MAVRSSDTKTIEHPELGTITLDCDVLTVQGSDLRLVVYSAPAGSDDAEKLKLLGVIGAQVSSAQRQRRFFSCARRSARLTGA